MKLRIWKAQFPTLVSLLIIPIFRYIYPSILWIIHEAVYLFQTYEHVRYFEIYLIKIVNDFL